MHRPSVIATLRQGKLGKVKKSESPAGTYVGKVWRGSAWVAK